ncbi:hypothetical protein [Ideonella azotifigens]|uniref:Uncharacterized protein n=1 Tax=Ideonella azotifigens TaxID=513160 RepID=A0ABN1K248_9BURK|nr:hypothetical protein [Ideonella azotifigens]
MIQYDHYATGLLKQATQPEGVRVLNTYDDAHRPADVGRSDGNSEPYDFDNAGSRRTEIYFRCTEPVRAPRCVSGLQ